MTVFLFSTKEVERSRLRVLVTLAGLTCACAAVSKNKDLTTSQTRSVAEISARDAKVTPQSTTPDELKTQETKDSREKISNYRIIEDLKERPSIDEWLQTQMKEYSLVGMGVAVVEQNRIRYLKGFGFADREAQKPSDPKKTRWRLASLSKGMTAVIATRLAVRGEIDLNADLEDLAPQYAPPTHYIPKNCDNEACLQPVPTSSSSISLAQLLHHRAGITHYNNGLIDPSPPQADADDAKHNTGIRWALNYLSGKPLVHLPGTKFDYSSFGFNLAGAVLMAKTKRSFDQLLTKEISEPARLRTLQIDRLWKTHPDTAIGYHPLGADIVRDQRHDVSWKAPGGGLVASIEDMAKYCGALMHKQLTGDARDQQLWAPAGGGNYAFGFKIRREQDIRIVEHGGSQQGARSGLHIRPKQKLCVIAMTNTTTIDGVTLVREIVQRWLTK
jgi:serine beta-lactamase-like protein LACTB, mitochondrial